MSDPSDKRKHARIESSLVCTTLDLLLDIALPDGEVVEDD